MKHMNPKIVIRSETDADVSAISEVTVAAFKTLEFGFGNISGLVHEGVPPEGDCLILI
jgi:hypothetical protein